MSRVVVGVDGSPGAGAALAFALEEARLRNLPLRIVSASEVPPVEYAGATFVPTPDLVEGAELKANTVLAEAMDSLGPDPGVEIEPVAVQGHPATVLVEQAEGAALLVVGSRGLGGVSSLLLGSVSQSVAHHSTGPLAIVPTRG
jgi:nucleotide-binding universal stress UspA family protein